MVVFSQIRKNCFFIPGWSLMPCSSFQNWLRRIFEGVFSKERRHKPSLRRDKVQKVSTLKRKVSEMSITKQDYYNGRCFLLLLWFAHNKLFILHVPWPSGGGAHWCICWNKVGEHSLGRESLLQLIPDWNISASALMEWGDWRRGKFYQICSSSFFPPFQAMYRWDESSILSSFACMSFKTFLLLSVQW